MKLLLFALISLVLLILMKRRGSFRRKHETGDFVRPQNESAFTATKKTVVGTPSGLLAYHRLTDWWLSAFSEEQRAYIIQKVDPSGEMSFASGNILSSSQSSASFLISLVSYFQSKADSGIGLELLKKAEQLNSGAEKNVLDEHFYLLNLLKLNYRRRDIEPDALQLAIEACEKQIAIAPLSAKAFLKAYPKSTLPSHTGFEQLAIIKEKQGALEEAISLCKRAKQQGWNGDWDIRIARCERKLQHRQQ